MAFLSKHRVLLSRGTTRIPGCVSSSGVRVRPRRHTSPSVNPGSSTRLRHLSSLFVCGFTGMTQGCRPGACSLVDQGRDSHLGAQPGLASVSEAAVFPARRTCLLPGPPPRSQAERKLSVLGRPRSPFTLYLASSLFSKVLLSGALSSHAVKNMRPLAETP